MNEILNQEKSIYIQISEMIENDILRDVLLEDERVPSTNELAKLYAINPSTAAKGINILVDAGILYKKKDSIIICVMQRAILFTIRIRYSLMEMFRKTARLRQSRKTVYMMII